MKPESLSPLEKLVEQYYQPVFRFAARLCGSPERAILLTLRTFRVAVERSRNLPVPANVRAWLITLLFHQFLQFRSHPPADAHVFSAGSTIAFAT